MAVKYIAKVRLTDRDHKVIAEAGGEVPAHIVRTSKWLLEQGIVEAVQEESKEK